MDEGFATAALSEPPSGLSWVTSWMRYLRAESSRGALGHTKLSFFGDGPGMSRMQKLRLTGPEPSENLAQETESWDVALGSIPESPVEFWAGYRSILSCCSGGWDSGKGFGFFLGNWWWKWLQLPGLLRPQSPSPSPGDSRFTAVLPACHSSSALWLAPLPGGPVL